MNISVNAHYFDGLSSHSKDAVATLNDTFYNLILQVKGELDITWALKDIEFVQYGEVLELRNKTQSGAVIKIENKEFSEQFYKLMKQNKRVDVHTRLLKLGFAKIMAIALVMFGLLLVVYFYVVPPLAEKSAAMLPESFDDKLGNTFMDSYLEESDIDSSKTETLKLFASKLYLGNTKPLHFAVVESDEVNAFALPNGQIVVYTAILDSMENYSELIALLGHEATHVNKRHTTKSLCRNLAGYMVVSLLLSDVNGVMSVLADNAQQLHNLSFSRQFEQEADEEGLKILMKNNADPQGMVQLFEQLESVDKASVPKILSSHPLTKERIKNMQSIISDTKYDVKSDNTLSELFEKLKE